MYIYVGLKGSGFRVVSSKGIWLPQSLALFRVWGAGLSNGLQNQMENMKFSSVQGSGSALHWMIRFGLGFRKSQAVRGCA